MSGHVWYSFASDVGGPALAEALDFPSSKKKPGFEGLDVLVCWGCKPGEKYDPKILASLIAQGDIRVLNHPEAIAGNRNKLSTLLALQEVGIQVPGLVTIKGMNSDAAMKCIKDNLQDGKLSFPLIGLNEFNKGKPVFCQTEEDLKLILKRNNSRARGTVKISYVRSFCHGTEYRLHVFRDEVLCAERKVQSKDPIKGTAEALLGRLNRRAKKNEKELATSEEEMQWIVEELATDLLAGPSHLQRSVNHGWELASIPLGEVPANALAAAISAVDRIGLDMGAVNVVVEDDFVRVVSITSAPSLSDQQRDLYVTAIKEFAEEKTTTKKDKAKEKAAPAAAAKDSKSASPEIIARISRRIRSGKISQGRAEEILKTLE